MSINLCRVVNQQKRVRSILLDKIDTSQGNFEGYAQHPKQKIYVPYVNPLDPLVKGYVDLVESDEVLLAMQPKGTIGGLSTAGEVTFSVVASSLLAMGVVSAAAHVPATPLGGQTGAAATTGTAVGGVATITGLTGMTAASVGNDLVLSGATLAVNNGTFKIVAFNGATSVDIANPAADGGAGELNNGAINWVEQSEPLVSITGTTFLSVAPDHTYVTLTNNITGAVQTISDTAIIAAGAPSTIGATAIKIQYGLITIGTPAAGWKVKVQANSKVSNQFTLT